jgi:hypothetical protein
VSKKVGRRLPVWPVPRLAQSRQHRGAAAKRLNDLSLAELRQLEAKLAGEERLIDLTPETSSAGN